jgi:hypothetical protein
VPLEEVFQKIYSHFSDICIMNLKIFLTIVFSDILLRKSLRAVKMLKLFGILISLIARVFPRLGSLQFREMRRLVGLFKKYQPNGSYNGMRYPSEPKQLK